MGFENQFVSSEMLLSQESVANADESTSAKMCFVGAQEKHRVGERNQLIKTHKENKIKILHLQIFSMSGQQCLQEFAYPFPFNNILVQYDFVRRI